MLDRLGAGEQLFGSFRVQVLKVLRDQEVALRFARGPGRNLQETNRLGTRPRAAALGDARRDGKRSATKLAGEHTVIVAWETPQEWLELHHELPTALPCLKSPEVVHEQHTTDN